eukprot:745731-Hanusia_phi.AAC.3
MSTLTKVEDKTDVHSTWDGLLQILSVPETESMNTPRKMRTNSPLSDETHDTISHQDVFEMTEHSDETIASASDKNSDDLRASHSTTSESSLSHESSHAEPCEQCQEDKSQGKEVMALLSNNLDSPNVSRNGTLRRCCSPLTSHLHGGNCNSFRDSEYASDEGSVASFLSEDSTVSVPNYYHCHDMHAWTNHSRPISECFVETHDEITLEQTHCNAIKHCSRILPENEPAKIGKPFHFEPVPCLMSLEDYPALSTTSLILQERDRRCLRLTTLSDGTTRYGDRRQDLHACPLSGPPCLTCGALCLVCAHYFQISVMIKRGLEKMILLTPMAVSIALLIYCFALEDPDLTDRELVSIPLLNAAEGGDVNQVTRPCSYLPAFEPSVSCRSLSCWTTAPLSSRETITVSLHCTGSAALPCLPFNSREVRNRASEEGKIHVVRLLLSRGADFNAQDCDGGRPLEKAAQQVEQLAVSCHELTLDPGSQEDSEHACSMGS